MERKKTKLSGFFNVIDKIEDFILALTVIGMIIVILIQIVGRVIGHPFPWTEEMSRYLFLWMMFIALAAGFNKCESARVTLLLQIGPKWLKKASEILYFVAVEAFFVFMVIYGAQVVQQLSLIGICQPIGGVLGLIGTLQNFMEYHGKVAILDKEAEKKKALENS